MLIDAVTEQGGKLIESIRDSQRKKKLSASGRTAASLRLTVEQRRHLIQLRILGSRVFRILQDGRGPNRSGRPGREQIEGLTEWVKLRGLPLAAVWPIAMKQAKRGIVVPNRHNPGGILTDPLSRANLRLKLLPALQSAARDTVKTQLLGR